MDWIRLCQVQRRCGFSKRPEISPLAERLLASYMGFTLLSDQEGVGSFVDSFAPGRP